MLRRVLRTHSQIITSVRTITRGLAFEGVEGTTTCIEELQWLIMLGVPSLVIEEMTIGLGFAIIRSRSLGSELTLEMYTTSSLVHTS